MIAWSIGLPLYLNRMAALRSLFDENEVPLDKLITHWAMRVCNTLSSIKWCFAVCIIVVPAGVYLWTRHEAIHLTALERDLDYAVAFMPDMEWYSAPLTPKLSIIAGIGVLICSTIGFSTRVIYLHLQLLTRHTNRYLFLTNSAMRFVWQEAAIFANSTLRRRPRRGGLPSSW